MNLYERMDRMFSTPMGVGHAQMECLPNRNKNTMMLWTYMQGVREYEQERKLSGYQKKWVEFKHRIEYWYAMLMLRSERVAELDRIHAVKERLYQQEQQEAMNMESKENKE